MCVWQQACRSSLKIFPPQFVKCCSQSSTSSNISQTSGQKFSVMTSTPVTICIMTLITKIYSAVIRRPTAMTVVPTQRMTSIDSSTGPSTISEFVHFSMLTALHIQKAATCRLQEHHSRQKAGLLIKYSMKSKKQ